jgi:ribosomal protein L37AE/L43A
MKRPYRVMPCQDCGMSRVWSALREKWECPQCSWSHALYAKRRARIDLAHERYAKEQS